MTLLQLSSDSKRLIIIDGDESFDLAVFSEPLFTNLNQKCIYYDTWCGNDYQFEFEAVMKFSEKTITFTFELDGHAITREFSFDNQYMNILGHISQPVPIG